jgi:hypothetical protein
MATGSDWMSAASFIGMAGTLYLTGYGGLAFILGWTGGYCLVALFLAPYLRKFGQFTIPDFLGARYGGNMARLIGVFAAILVSFVYVVAQIFGVGLITARMTGLSFEVGVYVGLAGILALSGPKAGFGLAGARRVQLAAEQAHSLVLAVQGLRTSAFAPARARLVLASRPCRPVALGTALPGLGPPAWRLHLERARNGARPQSFDLEYDDATHCLYQPATLANRSPQPQRLSA